MVGHWWRRRTGRLDHEVAHVELIQYPPEGVVGLVAPVEGSTRSVRLVLAGVEVAVDHKFVILRSVAQDYFKLDREVCSKLCPQGVSAGLSRDAIDRDEVHRLSVSVN